MHLVYISKPLIKEKASLKIILCTLCILFLKCLLHLYLITPPPPCTNSHLSEYQVLMCRYAAHICRVTKQANSCASFWPNREENWGSRSLQYQKLRRALQKHLGPAETFSSATGSGAVLDAAGTQLLPACSLSTHRRCCQLPKLSGVRWVSNAFLLLHHPLFLPPPLLSAQSRDNLKEHRLPNIQMSPSFWIFLWVTIW